jgi:glycosyltransferase involved in cell wall biosynthesis
VKRVAIVAGNAFPPQANANVHRVLAWTRHLPRFGWGPVVLTLPLTYRPPHRRDESLMDHIPPDVEVHRIRPWLHSAIPMSGVQSFEARRSDRIGAGMEQTLRILRSHVLFPDTRVLWVPAAVCRLRQLVGHVGVDVVLSTSRENSSHIVGWVASQLLRLPWVADFQDPWESPWAPPANRVQARIERALGRMISRRADFISAMSDGVGRLLVAQCGAAPERVTVVPNGFEPFEDLEPSSTRESGERPVVLHTGAFYGRRTPTFFLQAVSQLVKERRMRDGFEVRFVGTLDSRAAREVNRYRNEPWLTIVGRVPHEQARRMQGEADVLLLIPGEMSFSIPSKVFEYLNTGTPILALTYPDSDTGRLLNRLRAGIVVPPEDITRIKEALENVLRHEADFRVPREVRLRKLEDYQLERVVARQATLLERAVSMHRQG